MPPKTGWDGKSVKIPALGRAGSSDQVQARLLQPSRILQDKLLLPSCVGECRSGFRHQILSNAREFDGQGGTVRSSVEMHADGYHIRFSQAKGQLIHELQRLHSQVLQDEG